MFWFASTTLCLLLAAGAEGGAPPAQTAPSQPASGQPWEIVGEWGFLKTVYVEPARIKDTKLLAQVVQTILDRSGTTHPLQLDFFDDKAFTPTDRPWPQRSYHHHRAKFNFNPKTEMRRFVWVEYVPVDPNQPTRVKAKETEETLPSP